MSDTGPSVIVIDTDTGSVTVDMVDEANTINVVAPAQTETITVIVDGGGGGGDVSSATATTMTATPNPSVLGQTVTLTAHVTGGGGLPVTTGTVTFYRDTATVLATRAVDATGTAVHTISSLTGASTNLHAAYNANAILAASASTPVAQVVISPPATTLALVSSDTTIDAGDSVTFTATVTTPGVTIGSGQMTFKRGTNTMAAGVDVVAGVASFTTTALPIGSWPITAEYSGFGYFGDSTSNTVTETVSFAGGPPATTTTLASDDTSSIPGQVVHFTATVVRTADAVAATSGTVTFKDGGSVLAALTINPTTGQATYTTSALSTASHNITADYNGGSIYTNSTSNTVVQIVAPGGGGSPTSQTMTTSKATALETEIITICSTVKSGTTAITFGNITFKEGATVLQAATPLNIYGEVELTTWTLPVGAHTITATYDGTPTYEADSTAIDITIVSTLPVPSPSDWDSNFHSNNLAKITTWYDYNTGHLAEGFDPADLWLSPGLTTADGVRITDAWLAANVGANVVNDGGGHWTITGLRASYIEHARSDLTFRHCWVHRLDYVTEWGGGIRIYDPALPSGDRSTNNTLTNVHYEYCTISTDGTGSDESWGDACGNYAATPDLNDLVMDHCEITQWRGGCIAWFGITLNYCWTHDLNLFGVEPHNTAASNRGRQVKFNRCYFTDGTSACVSLYADTDPYTDFWINENTMWVLPTHAVGEVNFPSTGSGWQVLLPGYVREFTGNKLGRGGAGDNQYWSKISDNTLITGEPLFGGASTVQTVDLPSLLMGASTAINSSGSASVLDTYHFTPSPDSTLLCFHGLGRQNSLLVPAVTISDESGSTWTVMPGCETPVEPGAAPTYGLSASLWTMQTSSFTPQAFRRLHIDPYLTTNKAYMSALIVEITGLTGMTLAQPAVLSSDYEGISPGDVPGYLPKLTTGTLANNTVAGNLVLAFFAWNHEEDGMATPPTGWNWLGNNFDARASSICLWRNDFVGKSVTLPSFGGLAAQPGVAVSILIEVAM